MDVSPDVIGTIIAAFGVVATLFAGIYVLLRRSEARLEGRFNRIDARFEQVDARFDRIDVRFARIDDRFDRIDARFARIDDRFDRLEQRLSARIDVVAADVTELKVAVARLEGPRPTLLRAR